MNDYLIHQLIEKQNPEKKQKLWKRIEKELAEQKTASGSSTNDCSQGSAENGHKQYKNYR